MRWITAKVPKFDRAAIEAKLEDAGRAWPEQLNEALYSKLTDSAEIAHLTAKYGNAFPVGYREQYEARQSVHDIFQMEQALASGVMARDLYRPNTDQPYQLRLKLFRPETPVVLSDILPILENMGIRVIAESPFEIKPTDAKPVWIHDFQMEVPEAKGKEAINVEAINDDFEETLLRVWNGDAENDNLNRLSLTAAMTWRDIVILRAYVRYMRQGKTAFSKTYLEKALTDFPHIARQIVDLFHARLNPKAKKRNGDEILASIETAMNAVTSLDQDRILRTVTTMVESTLRTKFLPIGRRRSAEILPVPQTGQR